MKKRDTLLIVDDMEVNRAILRSLFERQYNLLEAENGEQALLLLHEYEEHVAAMLLDLVMPVKNGYEVMEEMGKSGLVSRIPVIVSLLMIRRKARSGPLTWERPILS